jgi:N-acetylmuramoyl-L-alanine amidase
MPAPFHLRLSAAAFLLAGGLFFLSRVQEAAERNLYRSHAGEDVQPCTLGGCVVVVDAGHGGNDSGTHGHGIEEKTLTLDIAKRLQKSLQSQGVTVVMSRRDDTYIGLEERCVQTRGMHAQLFVSIHLNASLSPEAEGLEVYYSSHGVADDMGHWQEEAPGQIVRDRRSILLAQSVDRFVSHRAKVDSRGWRDSGFYVLVHAPCPAILVECGYVTNARESRRLKNEAHRQSIAEAIASAVAEAMAVTRAYPRHGLLLGGRGEVTVTKIDPPATDQH